jgi:hypothetical protein
MLTGAVSVPMPSPAAQIYIEPALPLEKERAHAAIAPPPPPEEPASPPAAATGAHVAAQAAGTTSIRSLPRLCILGFTPAPAMETVVVDAGSKLLKAGIALPDQSPVLVSARVSRTHLYARRISCFFLCEF